MIENLPSVAHLRYRGEPVEWRPGLLLGGAALHQRGVYGWGDYIGRVYPTEEGDYRCGAFKSVESTDTVYEGRFDTDVEAAQWTIDALVKHGVVAVVDETPAEESVEFGRIPVTDAEMALLTYAARLRGESVEDYIVGRALLDACGVAASISATDPVAKQLLLAAA